ncbi:MAG: 3-isopropylmalate dehydratase large subunit [Chloroflexi bacterium]|nr:3-isopropylmalate dehydratase large subunit [Chloroflexota bacterium]|tara:strand:- start:6782 stop:8179 length:1398 start_codon:yes stop_codon:yes gene_type:complete
MKKTLFEKIWEPHVVDQIDEDLALIYIDLHLVHEVTSPQAFEGLRINSRTVRKPNLTAATIDHNVPTSDRFNIKDPIAKKQIETLRANCKEFGVPLYDIDDINQGIVHVIGPELGLTQPGMTIVCGDSHTSTHGAFGALAFGIGTSEVEHVLATQTLVQKKPKTMAINVNGDLPRGVTPKDLILSIIKEIGVDGGTGHAIEFRGDAFKKMSMEGRMTVCNMTIEGGGRAGMIAPDEKTFEFVQGKKFSPKGSNLDKLMDFWTDLYSDENAEFDTIFDIDCSNLEPHISWGTNPGQVAGINSYVPDPESYSTPEEKSNAQNALDYMGLEAGQKISDIRLDRVFIGSCTNGRLEDLRSAANIIEGKKVDKNVRAMVVPGSGLVKMMAEKEGLDKIFTESGFEWRDAGCSMCLGMNPDILVPQERCASTSNRNFEGRQGKEGRTHLVSPEMAAAAAIEGHFVDVRNWK